MMLFYLFLIFCPLLNALGSQELVNDAQQAYAALMKKIQPEIVIASNTIDIQLLKQARKVAKQKGDVEETQELTERIMNAQRSFCGRHPLLTHLVSMMIGATFFCIAYRLGARDERLANGDD